MTYIAHQRKSDGTKQTVEEHLLAVAELAKFSAGKIGLPHSGELIGLLHDLGKYSSAFQNYINSALGNIDPDAEEFVDANGNKGKIDHSTAGAQLIKSVENSHKAFPYLSQILTLCISSHHGGLIDCLAPDGSDAYSKRMKKEDKETHYGEVLGKVDSQVITRINEILKDESLISELLPLFKIIPRYKTEFYLGLLTRYLLSCLLDADRTDTADFEYPQNKEIRLKAKYPKWDEFITALVNRLAEFKTENRVDEIRSEVSLACKMAGSREQGIFTLTVPTGGGKTLASLRFALEHARKHDLDRVIYVIPYTSIIDQNAREVQNVFADLSKQYDVELVLEHHSNLTPEKETTAQRLLAENWDAPIVYTTSVQLLDSLFKGGTRSARRMHNLAKSVIVFDEIQTLPVKTVHLFNNAMNFLTKVCGSSVVLCTATQPLLGNSELLKHPIQLSANSEIMPNVSQLFEELKRVEIIDKRQTGGLSDTEIAELIQEELCLTGSVLAIVNTKKSAENLYKLCKNFEAKVYHLSTNQCPQHRLELIDEIRNLANPKSKTPVICISTQLIEAGVDVDFGSVVRFVAGLDSIAQAAGRCNRSGKRDINGRVLIVNTVKENTQMLKDIEEGKKSSLRILEDFKNDQLSLGNSLLSTDALNQFFHYYFYNRKSEMDYSVETTVDDTILRLLSTNEKAFQIYKTSTLPLNQSFKTAGRLFEVIQSQTQGVIVQYGEGKEIVTQLCASQDITQEKKLLKKAQRYTVNCYANMMNKLESVGAIVPIQESGLFYLREEHYDTSYGISVDALYENLDSSSFCL